MAGTVVDHRAYFDSGISFFDFEVIFACISGDDMGVIENHVYLFVDNEATDCFDVAGCIELRIMIGQQEAVLKFAVSQFQVRKVKLTVHSVCSQPFGQLRIEPIKAIGTMRKCFGLLDQDVHDLFQEFFPDKLYTFKKDHRFADPHDEHIKAYGYSYFKNQQYI